MKFCRKLSLEGHAWSLYHLRCHVRNKALVLEVSSGENLYFRANKLLDAFEITQQRHWVPLIADRPTVLGTVERSPFVTRHLIS